MLAIERVEQERHQMLDSFIGQRNPVSLPNVSNYLVTLDYQALLSERQGLELIDDYGLLATAFYAAAGKQLMKPEYNPARGSTIDIVLPSGHRHGLRDLSSGEQEMLAMMYFVRRLSASGGILCIDEPEQHLHPTLQAALFQAMASLADRAQVLVVSHSVNLVASAPLTSLIQIAAPEDQTVNQAAKMVDHPRKVELVAELGITPADLFQNDMLLVVEGDTDASWLRSLFPVELGRAHVVVAGSSDQVLHTHRVLAGTPAGLPWLCVRDRDLMTDAEVANQMEQYPHLHIWPRRAIESMLLEPDLIEAVCKSVGVNASRETIDGWLQTAAEPLLEDVLEHLVEDELRRRVSPPKPSSSGGRYEKMKYIYEQYALVNQQWAHLVDKVVDELRADLLLRWPTQWRQLVDPKPVLAKLTAQIGALKSPSHLMSALVARARDDETVRPIAMEALRKRLVLTASSSAS
ncbi:ATP-dependent endonuclease [Nocardia sp. NPDC127526]|uniref:ATP-dependent nuclease n=1 Tax=Nocardia sp. NPDC127526 TaxID=3345393 RepID=UPI00362B37A0